MHDVLYGIEAIWIVVILFVAMALSMEASYRLGHWRSGAARPSKDHINAIQSAILGILALLLGFTFSQSLQRFDTRSGDLVDEANAIGTAYLQTMLLPEPMRSEARHVMRDYVDVRVAMGRTSTAQYALHGQLSGRVHSLQDSLWSATSRAVAVDREAKGPLQFLSSVNKLIDAFGTTKAGNDRHVPPIVMVLLYVTFLMAVSAIGFAAGVGGHRPSLVSWIMIALVCLLVYLILDLDRPVRGLIQVSQVPMVELQDGMRAHHP